MSCLKLFPTLVLFLAVLSIRVTSADPSSSTTLAMQVGPSATGPMDRPATTLPEAFAAIRMAAEQGSDWDSTLPRVEQAVRRHASDPTASIQALELLGELFPALPDRRVNSDGKSWSDFGVEYAQQIAANPAINGSTETGPAIRAAAALKSFAMMLEQAQPRGAAELLLVAGRLGRNLHGNPAFPREAVAGLAPFALAEAHGLALLGQDEQARQLVETAYAWGLVDFEEVLDDSAFQHCSTAEAITASARQRQTAYLTRIRPGIDGAIASFKPYSFDFALPSLDGSRLNKSHFSAELTIVDIWGTWCAPCRASLPHLARLQREFSGKGVRLVGIAMEPEETVAEIQTKLTGFAERHGITWDLLIGNDAVLEQIPGGGSLPTLVFLDSQGQVRFSLSGYHDYSQLKTVVERLLATPRQTAR